MVDVSKIGIYSREDRYLYAIATGDLSVLPKDTHSRVEKYYRQIALNGVGGNGNLSNVETENAFTSILGTKDNYVSDIRLFGKTVNGKAVGHDVDTLYIETVSSNLFDETKLDKYITEFTEDSFKIDYHTMNNEGYIQPIIGGGRYTFSYTCKETIGGKNPRFMFMYSDGTTSNINSITSGEFVTYKGTSTANKDVVGVKVGFTTIGGNWYIKKNSIILCKGVVVKAYTPYNSIKRKVTYYNPNTDRWEKPIMSEGTSIERHLDGKYYYHTQDGVFECNDISLLSYNDETNLILHFGELSPKTNIRLIQDISNVVEILTTRFENLIEGINITN